MKTTSTLFLCCWLFANISGAQTANPPTRSLPGNRYLLVIETSRAMQSRTVGLWNGVQELVGSGFGNQARPGDTVGLWTFNDALHSGKFPLQQWTTNSPSGLTNRILNFLKTQRYEKDPEQTALLKELNGLVKDSEFLTVVFFTSGLEKWNGTPFDRPFNEFVDLHRSQQEKARMPFFFALRAQAGSFVEYQVAALPGGMNMPLVPRELRAPANLAPTANLIVSGRKPEAVNPATASSTATPVPWPSLTTNTHSDFDPSSVRATNGASSGTNTGQDPPLAFIVDPPRSPRALTIPVSNVALPASADPASDPSNTFSAAAPATIATQVPPAAGRSILLPVLVIAVVFVMVLVWLLYRPSPPPKSSFITRSIDRDKL